LVTFRNKLLDAIVRRDIDYVVKQASSDIKLSFGGSYGQKDFRKSLALSAKDLADEYKYRAAEMREGYWDALEEVFRMAASSRPGMSLKRPIPGPPSCCTTPIPTRPI